MTHVYPRRSRRTSFRAVALSTAALVALPFGALALGAGSAAAAPTMPTVSTLSTITEVARPSIYRQTEAGMWLQGGDIDVSRERLYLADLQRDEVRPGLSVLNLEDGTASSIPLDGDAYAIDAAVSPIDGTVYVVHNTNQGYVSVVDPAEEYTDTWLPPLVAVGANPQKVEVGTDGRVYVVNLTGDTISILGRADSTERLNVIETLSGVKTAGALTAIDNERDRLFIASEYTKTVTVIDTAATPAAVVGTFSVENPPTGITVDPSTGDAVVVTQDDNAVAWFSTEDNWATTTIERTETLATISGARLLPLSATVRPDGTTLVVTQVKTEDGNSFVSVIPAEVTENTPVRTIPVGALAFWGVQDPRVGGSYYVPNAVNSNVSVIADLTLTAAASTATFGQDAQAQATLVRGDGYPVTASIEFTDSAYESLGSAPVDSLGKATLNLGKRAVGSLPFAAAAVIRDSVKLRVAGSATTTAASSTTTLTLNPAQVVEGGATSATVTVAGAHGTTPTGTVTLKRGADVVGTATLASGTATIELSALVAGSSQLVASYAGDASHASSASQSVALTVTPRTATGVLNNGTAQVGGKLTINLSGFAPNELVNLTLHSDPIALGSVRVNGVGEGSFTFTVPQVSAGKHSVVAVGASSGRSTSTDVIISANSALATTGADGLQSGLTVGLLALLLGSALMVWRSRRSAVSDR